MTRVIQSPKDTVDECVESIGAVKGMIGEATAPAKAASSHLSDAVRSLQLARDEIRRISR